MLKTLWKVFFMTLLLLAGNGVSAFAAPNKGGNKPGHRAINPFLRDTTLFRTHAFDIQGVCICMEDVSDDHLPKAPRIQLRKEAEDFIEDYIKENRFMMDKIMLNGTQSLTTIERIFSARGLPLELKYLAVIESKLKPSAVSGVGAAGIWQFMPATARGLGLKVSGKIDERRNNQKSTLAAAKYLERLYLIYEDWLLVVAAYNCGPGGVNKAIKSSGSRDFWKLQRFLPRETRLHVKKFISTHYYYENHGSLVTLTREETLSHIKAAASFLAKYQPEEQSPLPTDPDPDSTVHTRITAILQDQDQIWVLLKK